MTVGLAKGYNAMGHLGWVEKRCRVCGRWVDLTGGIAKAKKTLAYYCPNCSHLHESYFCHACARKTKYTCPYCGTKLVLLTPLAEA
ncbi:MAG: hypothetical protein N3F67_04940 [Acidilobaceae archaeon]|nr:hypothetical protein [Acidilobaceae archaeon]